MKAIKITAGLMGAAIVGLGVTGLIESGIKNHKRKKVEMMQEMVDRALKLEEMK